MKSKNHKKGQSNDVTLATTIQQQCIAIYINDIYINSIYIYIYIYIYKWYSGSSDW